MYLLLWRVLGNPHRKTDFVLDAQRCQVLPAEWYSSARAFYLVWLRRAANKLDMGRITPPRKAAKKARFSYLFDGLDVDSEEEESSAAAPAAAGNAGTSAQVPQDAVMREVQWVESIDSSKVEEYRDSETGQVDEFKFWFAVRKDFPIHYFVFRQVAVHVPTEANAEDTFSLSGSLSSNNTHTLVSSLSTLTRIQRNKAQYNPSVACILEKYKQKFRALKLGDDVEQVELGEEDDENEYQDDDYATDAEQ